MRSIHVAGMGGFVLFLLGLAGCGGSAMGTVAGKVTVDGKPVANGSILFVPADGQGPTTGGTIKDGQYSVRVPLGVQKVQISSSKVVGKKKLYPTPNSPVQDVTAEVLPPRYNERTELQLDVKSGLNPKDWELKGK